MILEAILRIFIVVAVLGGLAMIGKEIADAFRRRRLQAKAEGAGRDFRKRVIELLAMPEAELKPLAKPRSVEQSVYLYRLFSRSPHPFLSVAELQPGIDAIANTSQPRLRP